MWCVILVAHMKNPNRVDGAKRAWVKIRAKKQVRHNAAVKAARTKMLSARAIKAAKTRRENKQTLSVTSNEGVE